MRDSQNKIQDLQSKVNKTVEEVKEKVSRSGSYREGDLVRRPCAIASKVLEGVTRRGSWDVQCGEPAGGALRIDAQAVGLPWRRLNAIGIRCSF